MAIDVISRSGTVRYHTFEDYTRGEVLPGVVVPQQIHRDPSHTAHNIIRFYANGQLGISITNARNPAAAGLQDANTLPQLAGAQTIAILWPGYQLWSSQIQTVDSRRAPITLARLASSVAHAVEVFMTSVRNTQPAADQQGWRVGLVEPHRLYLVELRHVASGIWQPVLCWSVPR